ncbi:MAG: PhnD/SsuA/transferrin family substrate-binding protein, partial [Verrucomicrobiota bacterium]|nr:PhnD/SsuA/transferrin family substrate-binding protein [Verrucomicrobiota bacterium]
VESGKLDKEKCKIIWKTAPYANYNWTAHPELDQMYGEGFIDKIQEALIDISDEQLLKTLTRSKIISAKNEDFQGIADIAKKLGFLNN